MNSHQLQIIRILDTARFKIQIAVSWFTDEVILLKIIEKSRYINVEILTSADEMNLLRHTYFRTLLEEGAIVKKVGSSSPLDGDFMHSKFIIIDNSIAWGGSYNFTNNARSNYETFKKWDNCELEETIREFNSWMKKAVDFFYGITDVDQIVRRLKEKFIEEQKKDILFPSNILPIQFSEQTYIEKRENEVKVNFPARSLNNNDAQKERIKEETIRQSAQSISNNTNGISTSGKVLNGTGILTKPHSFHGGSALKMIPTRKKYHHSLICYQKYHIDRTYKCLKTRIKNGILICTGEIQPIPESEVYHIKIEFIPGLQPRVYIKSPEIANSNQIHVYREGFLCLFDPSETHWRETNKLAEYTVPWVVEWILYYELWKLSGRWEGRSSCH